MTDDRLDALAYMMPTLNPHLYMKLREVSGSWSIVRLSGQSFFGEVVAEGLTRTQAEQFIKLAKG